VPLAAADARSVRLREWSPLAENFRISVLGNTATCRTEAEVYVPRNSDDPIALVYETEEGWVVEQLEDSQSSESTTLQEAVESAKRSLGQYVNRTGKGAPVGLTAAGLSLWLMMKADGTAMGRRIT
jgi:hypothetical protein